MARSDRWRDRSVRWRPARPVGPDVLAGRRVGRVLADLDPGLLLGRDAAALYGDFARLERLVVAGKTLLAPRIADSGHWESTGHRSAAGLLATLEGGSTGQARRTLEAGRRLVDLPGTEEALRPGTLSGPKLAEITQAAALDPPRRATCWPASEAEPLPVIKERCQRVPATAAGHDPVAALSRIHARRTFTSWTDGEGAFCFEGRDTPERGAALLARLVPVANRLRHDRRAAASEAPPPGRPGPGPGRPSRTRARTRAGGSPAGRCPLPAGHRPPVPVVSALRPRTFGPRLLGLQTLGPHRTVRPQTLRPRTVGLQTLGPQTLGPPPHRRTPDPRTLAHRPTWPTTPSDLGSVEDLVADGPGATVIVRVDLAALRRGRARPGELCELDGHGPVPVPVAHSLLDDAFVALVFTEAGDIRAVVPPGADHQRPPAHRPGPPGPALRGPGVRGRLRPGDRPRAAPRVRWTDPRSTTWPCCVTTTTG